MKTNTQKILLLITSIILIVFILHAQTVASGAAEGIALCINVLIPSLFPFLVVTSYWNQLIYGIHFPGLNRLGNTLHIPPGSESLLFLGLLGGYPVGAKAISDAYLQGYLDRDTGRSMLGYCSNAGPAFIFGITGILFQNKTVPWILWGIHIFSAILTGILLPKPRACDAIRQRGTTASITASLQNSLGAMAAICGWVILFKTFLVYLENLVSNPQITRILTVLSGFLELSNGSTSLSQFSNESIRFVLCAVYLAFGGLCVMMQTTAVASHLGLGLYIPGKILQTLISLTIALLVSRFLFAETFPHFYLYLVFCPIFIAILVLILRRAENYGGNTVPFRV